MKKIAILGFGTVGSGVHEVLCMNAEGIAARAKSEIQVKYILDVRDFSTHEYAHLFTNDFEKILGDDEVSTVVECIGGIEPAYTFTKKALAKGKNVVTSNKELVATHGAELLDIAEKAGVFYLFEASVGGGIPVLRPMNLCLAANEVTEIKGILNGTTNYILTRMVDMGISFEDALKKAQELGYAERNPAADVEGKDAGRKIAILASLVCGRQIDPEVIKTEGITDITLEDTAYARIMDMAIKLIGYSKIEGDKVFARVSPMMLPLSNPLTSASDVFNAVMVSGNAVDDVMFYGRGAGKLPTASAVVADVIDIARCVSERARVKWEKPDNSKMIPIEETVTNALIRVKREYADQIKNDFAKHKVIDAGIEGEVGIIVYEAQEKTLNFDKNCGFIKLIRMA